MSYAHSLQVVLHNVQHAGPLGDNDTAREMYRYYS